MNRSDEIFYRFGKNGRWEKIDGRLKQISVSADGQHVWGVNKNDEIYYRFGKDGKWEKIDGGLKQISVSADGQHVWGVNRNDEIYYGGDFTANVVSRILFDFWIIF